MAITAIPKTTYHLEHLPYEEGIKTVGATGRSPCRVSILAVSTKTGQDEHAEYSGCYPELIDTAPSGQCPERAIYNQVGVTPRTETGLPFVHVPLPRKIRATAGRPLYYEIEMSYHGSSR
ncbi:hypothetical protein KKHLCK_14955 [Candidatus Electrothrix laxa]